jgi:RNA polymerase sigma-70 factor (ECF subfamily)
MLGSCHFFYASFEDLTMVIDGNSENSRLSAITTNWEEVIAARGDASGSTRNQILIRYAACAYKYILQAARNADLADDLSQEFALRFVRGDYRHADPTKGRFRDYLRASLRNLVTDYYRKNKDLALSAAVAERLPDEQMVDQLADLDREFQQNWREHVLGLAWEALRQSDSSRSNDYFTVLKFRSLHPDASSKEMADQLSVQLGQAVSPEWVRKKISRARQKFAELLASEVRHSLSDKSEEAIREELASLGLLKYTER